MKIQEGSIKKNKNLKIGNKDEKKVIEIEN
jgi:hypothetical protein